LNFFFFQIANGVVRSRMELCGWGLVLYESGLYMGGAEASPPPPLFGWEEEEEKKGGKEMRSRKRRETNDASGERQSITALCTGQTCATGGLPPSQPVHLSTPSKPNISKK
jgi:hypothetical protein